MEYRYSHLIDRSSYDSHGLCDEIPLRCHRNSDIEEFAASRAQSDWCRHVGPIAPSNYAGTLGPTYSLSSVVFPECLPDRLDIISYVMEFAFLHDDAVDTDVAEEVWCSY